MQVIIDQQTTLNTGERCTSITLKGSHGWPYGQYFKGFVKVGGEWKAFIRFPDDGWLSYGDQSKTFILENYYGSLFLSNTPNNNKIELRFEHHGDTLLGGRKLDNQDRTVTLVDNSYVRPTITIKECEGRNLLEGYIQTNTSYIRAVLEGTPKFGASIKSYNLSYSGSNETSTTKSTTCTINGGKITQSGYVTVTATITDTRGFTNTATTKVWVIDDMPSVKSFTADENTKALHFTYTPANAEAYSKFVLYSLVGDTEHKIKEFTRLPNGREEKSDAQLLSPDDREKLYNLYPNSTDIPLKLVLQTFGDANYTKQEVRDAVFLGDVVYEIPESEAAPTVYFDTITYTPNDIGYEGVIKGKNGVIATVGAGGKYGATITWTEWTINNEFFDESISPIYTDGESSGIIYGTDITLWARAQDSRGFTYKTYQRIQVRDYIPPQIVPVDGETSVRVYRVNKDTLEPNDEGAKVFLKAKFKFSQYYNKVSQAPLNKCNVGFNIKAYGGSSSYIPLQSDLEEETSIQKALPSVTVDKSQAVYIVLQAVDSFGSSSTLSLAVPSSKVFMDRRGEANSIAFGGYSTIDNAFEVNQDAYFRNNVALLVDGKFYNVKLKQVGDDIVLVAEEKQ